ncbi:MAG: hypothetical protein AAGF97_11000 [Planctomycetota bacterium]
MAADFLVEPLEQRRLLAASVVTNASGDVRITSDNSDTDVEIVDTPAGVVVNVDGQLEATLTTPLRNLTVRTKAGDDSVQVDAPVSGRLQISLGDGQDTVTLSDKIDGSEAPVASINLGSGQNALTTLGELTSLTVVGGNDGNQVDVDGVSERLNVRLGRGSDHVVIHEVAQSTRISLGSGTSSDVDELYLNGGVGERLNVSLGNGTNYAHLAANTKLNRINGGRDADHVVIAGMGNQLGSKNTVSLNSGNDTAEFQAAAYESVAGEAAQLFIDGVDQLYNGGGVSGIINAIRETPRLTIRMGSGDDHVATSGILSLINDIANDQGYGSEYFSSLSEAGDLIYDYTYGLLRFVSIDGQSGTDTYDTPGLDVLIESIGTWRNFE